ncbi:hypothetical protein GPECTOR_220g473 [Gonium pectorale]|uniref:AP2/ERF domain-containing protein n=1 Tax=Gonium pectorale TaxID=33097 RepID=A0A150FXW4_GONPE|nr:hypothetical protein GPECTOR_220g473 [Gonium pectorale]|eukprot:KXZ42025.1 hypothetical protein GPECTOR_220g473 [Gonium pectorale]
MKPRKVQSDGRLGFSMRSSKYTGVYRTPGGRWRAQFCYRGAVHQLGMYDTEREAAAAWDQAVVTFRGSASGVQLNLPHLLNSYDLQDVREHIHQILDSKIATTRTKRCLNSYARNPPGPASPSRVVPTAIIDTIVEGAGADPQPQPQPQVPPGGAVGAIGGGSLAGLDVGGVAMLGLAALRRHITPIDPSVVGAMLLPPIHADGGMGGSAGGPLRFPLPPAAAEPAGGADAGPAIVSGGRRRGGGGGGLACGASDCADDGAVSSSDGERDVGPARARAPSPKRHRKSHAVRARDQ